MLEQHRVAIIDIGSNSVRLVVYAGPARAPQPIFNEKLMVGLGANLATSGCIEEPGYSRAIAGLTRFRALANDMGIANIRCVATAAVREAKNSADFMRDARGAGHDITILTGKEEARASGYGVISAIPDADGIVADLGGGSLELVRVKDGATAHHTSFPFGVLRLSAVHQAHGGNFSKKIRNALSKENWPGDATGLPLYLVGGSWRALARFHMMISQDTMPLVSGHVMEAEVAGKLHDRLMKLDANELQKLQGLSSARVSTIPVAASLLLPLIDQLQCQKLIVSASGLREGLLYQDLTQEERAQDPLLIATEAEGRRFARFAPNGAAMDQWIAPLFTEDDPENARLRLAACHLSEVASTASPDFRAERAAEMAMHGQWLGIDMAGRMVLAQALFTSAGGQGRLFADAALACRLTRAWQWGLAMRLAQRLSGGTIEVFAQSALIREKKSVTIALNAECQDLMGEQVLRRLNQLAACLGLSVKLQGN
ncbi:MAG: Ppx/GppA family phosphatase [Sphingopyxis sp.]